MLATDYWLLFTMCKQHLFICALCCVAAVWLGACRRDGAGANQSSEGGAATPVPGATIAGQPIDTMKLDAEIAQLEREAEKDPDDDVTRTSLAQAYFQRGDAFQHNGKLNEALSDYQRTLRYDPEHEEANLRAAQIVRELQPEPRADDGKPVAVPASPQKNSNE